MPARVHARRQVQIASESDISVARREVRQLAEHLRFDPFAVAAITTAASELARNVWGHAGGGTVTIEEVEEGGRAGVRLEFRDRGPGIADVPRVLAGGFSTRSSLGLGVSASRRLVDDFAIESAVGQGTVVTVTKWRRF